jgi:hypothetical protein
MGYASTVTSTTAGPSFAGSPPTAISPSAEVAVKQPKEPPPLVGEELRKRAALHSPELVAELHSVVLRQIAEEATREARIDTKATSLLSAVGISISLLSAFMGPSVVKALSNAAGWLSFFVYALLLLAALSAIGTGIVAVLVLRVRGYGTPHDEAIWNAGELSAADAKNDDKPEEAHDRVLGVAQYRRYMLVSMWEAHVKTRGVNDRRAKNLLRGQWVFVGFCVLLLFLGGLLVAGISP